MTLQIFINNKAKVLRKSKTLLQPSFNSVNKIYSGHLRGLISSLFSLAFAHNSLSKESPESLKVFNSLSLKSLELRKLIRKPSDSILTTFLKLPLSKVTFSRFTNS